MVVFQDGTIHDVATKVAAALNYNILLHMLCSRVIVGVLVELQLRLWIVVVVAVVVVMIE